MWPELRAAPDDKEPPVVDFAKKVQKKGAEFLHPGETVVAAVPWAKPGSLGKQVAFSSGGVVGAAIHAATNRDKGDGPDGPGAADTFSGKQAILAVTDQRVIAFSQSAMSGSPKEILGEWSYDQIVKLELEKQKLTHRAALHFADGSVADGEIVRAGKPEKFQADLARITG